MNKIARFFNAALCAALSLFGVAHAKPVVQRPRVIVMLGAPGAGKGTVAVKLSETLQLPHISTGDLFRANIGGKTELGKKAQSYMDKGDLVPDELVLDMLFARVQQDDCHKGYVLDGFPRTLPQAQALSARLEGKADVVALSLEVPEEKLVERIVNRRVCVSCGAPYHLMFKPPQTEGKCDHCSSELIHRSDDTKEVVLNRLSVYHKQTAPVETFYKGKGCVLAVDGNQTPRKVFEQALAKLQP